MRLSDVLLPREISDEEANAPRELEPVGAFDLVLSFVVPIAALFLAIPQFLSERVGQGMALLATGLAGGLCWWIVVTLIAG